MRPIEVEYPVDWPLEGNGAEVGLIGRDTQRCCLGSSIRLHDHRNEVQSIPDIDLDWDWLVIVIVVIVDIRLDHPDPIDPHVCCVEDFLPAAVSPLSANIGEVVLLTTALCISSRKRGILPSDIPCVSSSTTYESGSGVILVLPLLMGFP
ncbi:MAG: hypothetical protein GY700_12045 [Propionibacteriaceae bacterium]|nr:hypothetical protein [Propionibacteriaceae bacterium]